MNTETKNITDKSDEINSHSEKSYDEKTKITQKRAEKAALQIINHNFFAFFGFELLYKFLAFSLMIPLIRKASTVILFMNGIDKLTNQNFWRLFVNPLTWIGILFVIYIAGAFISIEFSGLCGGIHASDEGKKISIHEMFMNGLSGCHIVFHLKNYMYLVYVIIVLPLASMAETATLTGSFTFPGFIMEAINDHWYLTAIYTIGMLALMYLALRWIYTIPAINLRYDTFSEAAAESGRLMHRRTWKAVWALITCYAYLFLLGSLLAAAMAFVLFGGVLWLDPGSALNAGKPIVIIIAVTIYILFLAMSQPLVLSRIYIGYQRMLAKEGTDLPAYQQPETWFSKNKAFKIALCTSLAVGIYFFLPSRYQEVKLILNNASNKTMVMAHRGDSVDAPENTLPAFQAAIDHGADAAEMDVQMTKDGTIVVLHDSSIDRTSTGSGKIWNVTYDEIKDLDNGSFFNPSFSDTHIPTLDQVIKLCKGKLYLNIEIKRTGHDDGIEKKVLDIIKANNFQNQCDITSMDYNTLVTVRSLDPSIKTVYTTTVALGNVADLTAADAFSVETTFVNQSFVRSMRQNGKQLFVWTVNDENQMETMINLGANAIITNDPTSCRNLVDSSQTNGTIGVLLRLKTGLLGS